MKKILLHVLAILVGTSMVFAQDDLTIRSIDGSGNNLSNPSWGAAGENLVRFTGVGYSDGISTPGGINRPNPRNISNVLFAQDGLINDRRMGLSDFCWVFGQFIDHDIGLTPDGNEPAFVDVPRGDPWFDPGRTGTAIIPMMRNTFDAATGTSVENPRQHPNIITAFIDGSTVYGSDEELAAWLRTFTDGKLKTSAGNLLPYNTFSGEYDDEIDHNAPEMDNPVGLTEKLFVAGDVRVNENPLLIGFHTLFVREHNRLCDELIAQHPDWTDEEIYQHARKIVGGLIQSVVYYEWLPTMGVYLDDYSGYDPNVNPQLMNVLTAAAFRLGHTLLNGRLLIIDKSTESFTNSQMALRDAFFNPGLMPEIGLDPIFRGMAVQNQQNMDAKIIDDVRNFLFGPPGAGGLDLASININRGRERGLPDFNTVRESFGLTPYRVFPQMNSDINVHARMYVLYRSTNWVDPWVGMLAEKPMDNSLFGETINRIMEVQFAALRDGDRFYFENDPVLSDEEKEMIKQTRMRDIIMRNTGIELMQPNVFVATPIDEVCPEMPEFTVSIETDDSSPVSDVEMFMDMGDKEAEASMSDEQGVASLLDMNSCEMESFVLSKIDQASNGVSTADLIAIQKHILGMESLSSPYKLLAADVNDSKSVTTLDLINIRNVVLGRNSNFPSEKVWIFIPADYEFKDPTAPFGEKYQENVMVFRDAPEHHYTFIGVKKGDVTNDAVVNTDQLATVDIRSNYNLGINIEDMELLEGNTYEVLVSVNDLDRIEGYQFGLSFDQNAISILNIETDAASFPSLSEQNFALFQDEGIMTTAWYTTEKQLPITGTFKIAITANQSGKLSDYLSLNPTITSPKAYSQEGQLMGIELQFSTATTESFVLYQNEPNPFSDNTLISFDLPESGIVSLIVYDAAGRSLLQKEAFFESGRNNWNITKDELSTTGVLYYEVTAQEVTVTKKMTVIE